MVKREIFSMFVQESNPMNKKNINHEFTENLFWDVRIESVDMENNAPYVVQRVLEYGKLSDWKLLLSYYGLARIVEIACHLRTLEPRAMSFISTVSETPKSHFRCYITKQ